METSLLTQTSEIIEFGSLPGKVRAEVDKWRQQLAGITPPVTRAFAAIASELGVSQQTVRRKYYAFVNSGGDWRSLVNWSRVPQREESVSPEFVQWFLAYAESNQRKTRTMWRRWFGRWQAGENFPGLDPALPRHTWPPGCSYDNLIRFCRKERAAQVAMRQGTAAAYKHLPQVFTTRVGLWPASHYMFDDLWHDNFVRFGSQLVRVLEFDALDVFSACKVGWGCKPRFRRDDGKHDNLNERMMRMLLASVLYNEGFSERGTTLMAEHGTAAIREQVERLLFDRTGGLIRVQRSGVIGKAQAVAGMFRGLGGGNPRFKSPLESLRNLMHNELAMLPGQTGMDVAHRPEQLAGLLKHQSDLLKAFAVIHPDHARTLIWDSIEYHSQFMPALQACYEVINNRTWHDLEGWHGCGNIEVEYRMAPDALNWIGQRDFLALPPVTQQMLSTASRADDRYARTRKLSPREVWQRGKNQLTKLPAFVVAELLGPDCAAERECKGGYFTFKDSEIAPETLIYSSRIIQPDGHERELRPDKYLTFVNPFAPEQLFVADAAARHLGVAPLVERVSRADEEAQGRALGERAERVTDHMAEVRRRHRGLERQRLLTDAHNHKVIAAGLDAPAPATPREPVEDCAEELLDRAGDFIPEPEESF